MSRQKDDKILFFPDDYKSELREQLPLIAGSAAAGVVFIVSLVAISIVCSRYHLPHYQYSISFSFQRVNLPGRNSGLDYPKVLQENAG